MTPSVAAILESLVAVGRADDYTTVAALHGAGDHAQVCSFSEFLRRGGIAMVEGLSTLDRAAFAKALAVYEGTVGGLGSVTALERVLPLVQDQDHAVLDWILSKTDSYWYYARGAKSFAELKAVNAVRAAHRAESERREAEREREAKARKAEQASANLFNAVRRGDVKAVQALLRQGATAQGVTPSGVPMVQYAEELNRSTIAELLHQAQGGETKSLSTPTGVQRV